MWATRLRCFSMTTVFSRLSLPNTRFARTDGASRQIGESCIDLGVELVDDLCWRVARRGAPMLVQKLNS